jgi:hypothetical protein
MWLTMDRLLAIGDSRTQVTGSRPRSLMTLPAPRASYPGKVTAGLGQSSVIDASFINPGLGQLWPQNSLALSRLTMPKATPNGLRPIPSRHLGKAATSTPQESRIRPLALSSGNTTRSSLAGSSKTPTPFVRGGYTPPLQAFRLSGFHSFLKLARPCGGRVIPTSIYGADRRGQVSLPIPRRQRPQLRPLPSGRPSTRILFGVGGRLTTVTSSGLGYSPRSPVSSGSSNIPIRLGADHQLSSCHRASFGHLKPFPMLNLKSPHGSQPTPTLPVRNSTHSISKHSTTGTLSRISWTKAGAMASLSSTEGAGVKHGH